MLFYFSGTGNSEFVATTLSNFLQQQKIFIPEADASSFLETGEDVNFVFPIYSWGVPPLIKQFILNLPDIFFESIRRENRNINCVMVCGDEVGLSVEMFEEILKKRGGLLTSAWSVIMPNNYVLLPGFDVDTHEVEQRKLEACKGRIMEIAESLGRGDKRIDVVKGSMAWIKTKTIYPLFTRWGISPSKWHYESNCISCGKCETVCPLCNVKMENGHPKWGSRCCSCLGCYHICPVHAVEYGRETKKKGQYFFPLKKISSQRCHK